MKYIIHLGTDEGTTTIHAKNLREAQKKAEAWINEVDWECPLSYIEYYLTDKNNICTSHEALIGKSEPKPMCRKIIDEEQDDERNETNDKEMENEINHDWRCPESLVGESLVSNGLRIDFEVCRNCGMYRKTTGESIRGQLPHTPELITFHDADKKSLKWIARCNGR